MSPLTHSELILRRLQNGTTSSPELEQLTGQSQSAVSRRLRQLITEKRIIRIGATRGARYGLLREIEGIGSQWPLRRIDQRGNIHILGTLSALAAGEYYFEAASSRRTLAWTGITSGLPYFLQDQRPAGFLGRAVPRRYPELNLPQRVNDWNDDHYLRYLTQRGSDTVSDLILGDQAMNDYLALQRRQSAVPADEREIRYPQLVNDVMEGGLPGSSAHGEHPKFAVIINDSTGWQHVLVKFSPTTDTAVGQRWSDLLVAEHVAHEHLRAAGIPAAHSRIYQFAGRAFLEVTRFDRERLDGRIGVTSLFGIDASLYGAIDNWIASATRLHSDRRIDSQTLECVRLVATFGALIANTDRHFGNLAFFDTYDGRFSLAPVYDMLPMLFAPEHSQLMARTFVPPDPTSETLRAYGRARALAEDYWQRIALDSRVSNEFRQLSVDCREALLSLPRTGAYVPDEELELPSGNASPSP